MGWSSVPGSPSMASVLAPRHPLAILALFAALLPLFAARPGTADEGSGAPLADNPPFEQAKARGLEEKKPILLDFFKVGCEFCAQMKEETLSRSEVEAALSGFVRARYDGEGMLQRFREELVLPFLATLRRFYPLSKGTRWSGVLRLQRSRA